MAATAEAPYEVSPQRTHLMVTVRPALTDAEWAVIEKAGDDILSHINGQKPRALIVDLSPLEFMGSSLVAMIVRCWKALHPKEQRFVVISDSEVVREVLELSGLSKMWTIVKTPEEGFELLGISTEPSAAKWACLIGLLAVLVAAGGVGIWFAQPARQPLATALIAAGAGLGFVLGLTAMMLSASGKRRVVGLGLVLLSTGAGIFRLMQQ